MPGRVNDEQAGDAILKVQLLVLHTTRTHAHPLVHASREHPFLRLVNGKEQEIGPMATRLLIIVAHARKYSIKQPSYLPKPRFPRTNRAQASAPTCSAKRV